MSARWRMVWSLPLLGKRVMPRVTWPAFASFCIAFSAANTALAQVWGHVDERGVAHFASERVDERYELFYRGEAVLPNASARPVAPALQLDESGWETPALVGTAPPATGAVVAPVSLLAFFEVSPAYKAVRHHIRDASRTHGLPPELLQAVIAAESGFDPLAVSPRGAVGLMQIMPTTAEEHGVKATDARTVEDQLIDPRINIHTGARLLAKLHTQFPQRTDLVVAAYNAGAGAVRKAGRQVPDFAETRNYVRTVMQIYQFLLPPPTLQLRARAQTPSPFSIR
jgi:soluble lytic murein transglycosylase-like protein